MDRNVGLGKADLREEGERKVYRSHVLCGRPEPTDK